MITCMTLLILLLHLTMPLAIASSSPLSFEKMSSQKEKQEIMFNIDAIDSNDDDDDDDDYIPATMESSAIPQQLYHQLYEPYKSIYVCSPRHLHLSPGDTDIGNILMSGMTISFTLPFHVPECHPDRVIPSIVYWMDEEEEEDDEHQDKGNYNDGDNNESKEEEQEEKVNRSQKTKAGKHKNKMRVYPTKQNIKQYNITSSRYKEPNVYYESDWIYHVQLHNLKSGQIKYWYEIEVEQIKEPSTKEEEDDAEKEKEKKEEEKYGEPFVPTDNGLNHKATALYLRRRAINVPSGTNLPFRRTTSIDESFTTPEPFSSFTVKHKNKKKKKKHGIISKSPKLHFYTPPIIGSTNPVKIAIVGDLGQTGNSTLTMSHMLRSTQKQSSSTTTTTTPATSLILIAGDMSYADSNQTRWSNWFTLIEPLLRHTPLAVAVGNHEIECDANTLSIFTPYENWFRMPNRVKEASIQPISPTYKNTLHHRDCSTPSEFTGVYDYGNAYYAFQHGPVHIIVLSSYSDCTVDSKQYQWLQNEFTTNVNRTTTPWVIVMFHSPIYTTFRAHYNETEEVVMQQSMEHLFLSYRVNLIISGHAHAYMRSFPMRYGHADPQVNATGPVYIIVGAGGNREGHVGEYLHPHEEPEDFVAKRDRFEYGYGEFEVVNAKVGRWKWIRDGTTELGVRDDVYLMNQYFL